MKKPKNDRIIIGVLTCPKNHHRADGIRETWLKLVPDYVRVLFVFARPGRNHSLEGNELYLNCPEAYEKLPEKAHLFYEFCAKNFDFDYIFKTDDDSYIEMNKFLSFDKQGGDYIGRFQGMEDSAVTRTWHYGKCTDKTYEIPYEGEYVCDWARGGGYFLSRKAVDVLLPRTAVSFSKELFEDKMVGDALGIDARVSVIHAEYQSMGVTNPVDPGKMLETHQRSMASGEQAASDGHHRWQALARRFEWLRGWNQTK